MLCPADLGVRGVAYEYGMDYGTLKTFAERKMEGLKQGVWSAADAGSSEPLPYMVMACTSPEKSWSWEDPAYAGPMQAAAFSPIAKI